MSLRLREVHPGVFLVHLPLPMKPTIVNVYLVRGGDEWALIDTGINSPDSVAAFRDALAEVGCAPERLGKILCTHHHPDHFGASAALSEMTGARVYIHAEEVRRAEAFMPRERPKEVIDFFRSHGIPLERFAHVPRQSEFWGALYAPARPDAFYDDGDVIEVGERRIEVVWTPGHAPGHCVLVLGGERVMVAGDHLLPKITPHVGFAPGSDPNPLADFLDSQRKVARLEVDLVLPAHGGVFRDHRHRAGQIIQHHEARLREMLDIVSLKPRTAYDIARRAFGFDGDSPVSYQFPATFETLAHLEYLRHAGALTRERREDFLYYAAA